MTRDTPAEPGALRTGLFRARVVSNQDPDRRGRVQVRVPQLHGEAGSDERRSSLTTGVASRLLPWAEPCFPLAGGPQYGQVFIPPTDAWVWVGFECGWASKPVYLGGWYALEEVPDEVEDPDKQRVIRTPAGHVITIDDADDGRIVIRHQDGHRVVTIDGNSRSVEVQNTDGQRIRIEQDEQRVRVDNGAGQQIDMDAVARRIRTVNEGQTLLMDAAADLIQLSQSGQSVTLDAAASLARVVSGAQQILLNAATQAVVLQSGTQTVTMDGAAGTAVVVNGLSTVTITALGLVQVLAALSVQLHAAQIELGVDAVAQAEGVCIGAFRELFNTHTHTDSEGGTTTPPLQQADAGVHTSLTVKAQA